MCYDISFTADVKELGDYFPDVNFDDQIEMEFESAAYIGGHDYADHPILFRGENIKLQARLMHWSYVPPQVTDLKQFAKFRPGLLNAKSEKIFNDPKSYWYKIKNNRCLIPVTAIYEHREIATFKNKIPYHITLNDQKMFFIPGLYGKNYHVQTDDEVFWSFTMLTRTAEMNWLMRQIHNGNAGEDRFRMVLLVPFELAELFLSPDLSDEDYKMILNYEMPADNLKYYTVASIRSPKPRPDGKPKDVFFDWGIPAISKENNLQQASLF